MTIAYLFPGQGSQSVGMLADLAEQNTIIQETFDEASTVLGYSAWQLAQSGPESQLNQTEYTQPLLLAADVAAWRFLGSQDHPRPTMLAGHSLGEFAALVCAGAIEFSDALACVALRGQAMQAAVPSGVGAMAAIIGLEDEAVQVLCDSVREKDVLSPANFNSKGQVVISGHAVAVERALAVAKSHGAKMAVPIPVSVPSHCALMASAATALREKLSAIDIKSPTIPVIHNADVRSHESPEAIRKILVEQLIAPVRWVETIEAMVAGGIESFIECGPGKVLTGLNRRINKTIKTKHMGEFV